MAEELLEAAERPAVGQVAEREAVTQRVRVRELHGHDILAGELGGGDREASDDLLGGARGDGARRLGGPCRAMDGQGGYQGAIAGAGFVAGGVLINGFVSPAHAAISRSRKSKANDAKILKYALTLEYLESAFYEAANTSGALTDPLVKRFAEVTGKHEAEHVAALRKLVKVAKPKFDFGDTVTNEAKFKQTAQALEDTGVSAYAGQRPNILQKPVIVAALSIHSVEARHAAWIRFLNSGGRGSLADLPAPASFDESRSEKAVLKIVAGTGFIK